MFLKVSETKVYQKTVCSKVQGDFCSKCPGAASHSPPFLILSLFYIREKMLFDYPMPGTR